VTSVFLGMVLLLASACSHATTTDATSATSPATSTSASSVQSPSETDPTGAGASSAATNRGLSVGAGIDLPANLLTTVLNDSGLLVFEPATGQSTTQGSAGTIPVEIHVYDSSGSSMGTVPAGAFDYSCGALLVETSGRTLVLTETSSAIPDQGINLGSTSRHLTAWDALKGTQLWDSVLSTTSGGGTVTKPSCDFSNGTLNGIAATLDGAYAVAGSWDGTKVVSLVDGHLIDLGTIRPTGVLGNWITTGDLQSKDVQIRDPKTGKTLGTVKHQLWSWGMTFSSPGMFVDSGAGPPPSGLSADGRTIFLADEDGTVTAYSLPNMQKIWSTKLRWSDNDEYPAIRASAPGLLIGVDQGGLSAYREGTGELVWTLPAGVSLCGITQTQMEVNAHSQRAVIDLASGKQLSYTAESGCTGAAHNGLAVAGGRLSRVLSP